ncbi:MAG: leucine-rich repeat domain-containing protein [Synergistaceae bacterium]|nr:leucine-rich repeat domain-containing protein [Synergistaceae bacterium]
MRKKLAGIVGVVMLILMVVCAGAWATTLRYNEEDQQWRDLEVQQVPWRSGNDPDNDYYGTNCFALVKWIVEIEGRGIINSYTNYGRVLDDYTGGQLVAQHLNDQKNAYPTAETVRADFSKAHLGDVVQMRWKYSKSTQHTAMINGFDDNGVYFFQSHVSGTNVKKIKNSYYSYADLAQRYSNAGSQGGYSIYYFASPVPDNTRARDKVVAYAWEIYNFKWYASQPILKHNAEYTGPRWVRGIPYTLYGTGDTFEQYKNLIDKNNEGVNNGLYDIVTYNIWTGESRTSMKHGMACATFVTTCIMQGFPNNAGLSMQPAIEFHTKNGWKDYVSVGSQSYDGYKRLQKGDYLDNFSSHVILVIDNHVGTGNGDSYIEYIDQTPVWDENNDIGTHKGTYYYSSLSSKGYRPMYVNYPGDSGGVPIDSAHFPDNYFREYVKNFDTNGDGYFSQSELDAVTEMWEENGPHPDNGNPNNGNYGYEWIKIESIEGIKLFRNLKSLCVYRDNIKEIDLSGMEHLERLYCYGNENDEGYGNRLTKLNLKNCSSLQELRCQNNQIKTLDLSGMDKLTLLWCWNNKIETLNLKGCKSLPELWARDNKLTSFNAEGCDSLKKAYLWNNSFTGFGQGSNYMPALEVLNLAGCSSMTGLNLTDYKNLKELHINDCSSLEWVDTSYSPNIANTVNTSGCNSLLTFDREPGVKVTGTAPTITTNSLPDAYVGKSYSATVSSSGTGSGNERIFFWIENGSDAHSNGFRLRNYKGNITGTPKQESNSMKITVRASNYVGETSKTFTVKVMPEITAPSITTTNLPDAYYGEEYNARISATGTVPIRYTIGVGTYSCGFLIDGKNPVFPSTTE